MSGAASYIVEAIGSVLVLTASGAIGYQMGARPARRMQALQEWRRLVLVLRGNLTYSAMPMPEIMRELATKSEGEYAALFARVAKRLDDREGKPLAAIWREEITDIEKKMSLQSTDLNELRTLGDSLGYLDRSLQLASIALYLDRQETTLTTLVNEVSIKQRLYRTLGVLMGALVVIVLL